jgi:hypothetical protein
VLAFVAVGAAAAAWVAVGAAAAAFVAVGAAAGIVVGVLSPPQAVNTVTNRTINIRAILLLRI